MTGQLAPAASKLKFDGTMTSAMQCTDLDRTIAWFNDVLGFSLMYKVDEIAWCELFSPVANTAIGFSQVESPQVLGGATLTFGVEDIDIARKTLEAHDVRFDGETIEYPGMVKLCTFFDPDGNKFMLSQSLSQDG